MYIYIVTLQYSNFDANDEAYSQRMSYTFINLNIYKYYTKKTYV